MIRSIALFLSGCGVILVIGGLLVWFNHAFPAVSNDNLRPMISPDGKLQAVLFRRNSSGQSAYTTHVAIIETGKELPNCSGTAFIAEGEPPVVLRWIDNNRLVIDEPGNTKVILRASRVGDIEISEN